MKKDTSVTYEQDSSESTDSLTTRLDKTTEDTKATWSPIAAGGGTIPTITTTRYSEEEDSFGMSDLGWKRAEKEHK